jgi:hypothetical protein
VVSRLAFLDEIVSPSMLGRQRETTFYHYRERSPGLGTSRTARSGCQRTRASLAAHQHTLTDRSGCTSGIPMVDMR